MTDGPKSERRPIVLPRFPQTRGECVDAERPCPHRLCTMHLVPLKREMRGHRGVHPIEQSGESCALDVSDRGPSTLEEVGEHMQVTRERIRQIEEVALRRLRARFGASLFGEWAGEERGGWEP